MMYIYLLICNKTMQVLDDQGFVLSEVQNAKVIGAWEHEADCRDEAITQIKGDFLIAERKGCVVKNGATLDVALFDLRTTHHGRILYHDPNGMKGNLNEIEYKVKKTRLR